ncbi:hypothetical protein NDU88_005902 [Pleurodeles waltl]|uniref:Uncharacterized protein n=1 Tax=Pleurodeles waltl TaxID=8319 RepID=A0AAV7TBZ8_PLEWA|nr:hypothetical protein NDU88_005902 [Pleurodeles waltl]
MAEDKVRQALLLLEEAGHIDLVRSEVRPQMHQARKSAGRGAAAVWACSFPVPGEGLRCSGSPMKAQWLTYAVGTATRGGARDKVLRMPSGPRSVKSLGGARLEVPSAAPKELKEEKVGLEGPKRE